MCANVTDYRFHAGMTWFVYGVNTLGYNSQQWYPWIEWATLDTRNGPACQWPWFLTVTIKHPYQPLAWCVEVWPPFPIGDLVAVDHAAKCVDACRIFAPAHLHELSSAMEVTTEDPVSADSCGGSQRYIGPNLYGHIGGSLTNSAWKCFLVIGRGGVSRRWSEPWRHIQRRPSVAWLNSLACLRLVCTRHSEMLFASLKFMVMIELSLLPKM